MKKFKETIFFVAAIAPCFSHAAGNNDATLADLAAYNHSIHLVTGIPFDATLSLRPESKFWVGPVGIAGDNKLIYGSKDATMAVEFRAISEESDEVIARKKDNNSSRAILTVFEKSRPVSHTFTSGPNQYTVNQGVCEILKSQTGSSSMSDFSSKAKTCSQFLKKQSISKEFEGAIADLQKQHNTNVNRLKESVGKDAIPAPAVARPTEVRRRDWLADLIATSDFRKEKPRPMPKGAKDIFSPDAFQDDVSYRAVLSEVADACAKFFPEPDTAPAAAAPPAGKASGAATTK